jgi:hypothetical protein
VLIDTSIWLFALIFIAAIALKEQLVLWHADSHFDLIAKHSSLKVESFVSLVPQDNP